MAAKFSVKITNIVLKEVNLGDKLVKFTKEAHLFCAFA